MQYNGWTNRSTWNVSLWLNNEEGLYNTVQGIIEELDDREDLDTDEKVNELAEQIRAFTYDLICLDSMRGLASDLLTSALDETNWHEIATVWLE